MRLVGTDAWSWDAPFIHVGRRYEETKDASIVWEGHKAGRERPYVQIEKLANLDKLPSFGFDVAAFPVTVEGGSGLDEGGGDPRPMTTDGLDRWAGVPSSRASLGREGRVTRRLRAVKLDS